MSTETRELAVTRWATPVHAPFAEPVFMLDRPDLPRDLTRVTIVLPTRGAPRAGELLAAGAARVLLADAVLTDSSLLGRVAREFGSDRVGVWVPVRQTQVSWSLDAVSNADFKCMTPSVGAISWEVLKSDMTPSGTEAGWWIEQMCALGASVVLIGADLEDGRDLDISADLVERFGKRLWLSPLARTETDLQPWVRFGKISQLVIPRSDYYDDAMLLSLKCAPVSPAGARV